MFSSTGEAQARAPEVAALRGDVGFGQAEDGGRKLLPLT